MQQSFPPAFSNPFLFFFFSFFFWIATQCLHPGIIDKYIFYLPAAREILFVKSRQQNLLIRKYIRAVFRAARINILLS